MPFSASDATGHTKQASTPRLRRLWSTVANSALKRGDSEGAAIRQANAVVRSRGHGSSHGSGHKTGHN